MGIFRNVRPELGSLETLRKSESRGWSLAIWAKSMPSAAIELMAALKSLAFSSLMGLLTAQIGVRSLLGH